MRIIQQALIVLFLSQVCLLANRPAERLKGTEEVKKLEGEQIDQFINAFRSQQLSGDYIFDFELEHRPARGDTRTWYGRMWGTWTPQGPLTRLRIKPHTADAGEVELLVQSGADPIIWRKQNGATKQLTSAQMHEPLFEGVVYTPYDLALPFAYWEEYAYKDTTRVKGFPAQVFRMTPPASVREQNPALDVVEATFHADYHALMKAVMLDEKGDKLRSYQVQDFKKIDDQYIVGSIELWDHRTRDYTRFAVNSAAVGLRLDPQQYFTPQALSAGVPPQVGASFKDFR